MRRSSYNATLGDRPQVKASHAVVILLVLVFVPYFNSLFNPFLWDDRTLIPMNPGIREGFKGVINAFSPTMWGLRADDMAFQSYYRPFHTLLSIVDYSVWGLNPFGYHLTNTLLHFLNTVLLYFFVVRLTEYRLAPLIAGAFFAVHPVHTEAVDFISSRPDLLCSMFVLASLCMYSASGRPREIFTAKMVLRPGYALSLVLFLFALLSKEMAVTLPLLVSMYALMYEEPGLRLRRVVPFFVLLSLYILFRVVAMDEFVEIHSLKTGFVTLAFTAATAVFDYTRLIVVPFPQKAYHPLVWQSALGIKVILSFALILAAALTALGLVRNGARAAGYALIWTYLTLLPVLNIGTLGEYSIAERYLYIPSAGAAVLFAVTVTALRRRGGTLKRLMPYVTVGTLLVFALLTVARNRVWSDDVVFFRAMVDGAPSSVLPHANLAHAYNRAGNNAGAIKELEIAVGLAGDNPMLYYELGTLYVRERMFVESVAPLSRALELAPAHVEGYNTLGIALAELGRMDEAELMFKRALVLDPGSTAAAANIERLRRSVAR